ncbi:hypothetical protein DdX_17758 [Ditylenchus destructor]|uniref:Transmembrane protein n=1 Tax=Ditylenchus destructor TaxID=166010 RepID=A0AAD4MRB7_9BILA|nr:hypothetical protein DdX_17758 [Ditylenchus destructor]
MGSSHMFLFAMFALVIPTFSRIHPSPIDDAIQMQASQGPVKHVPAYHAKNVKHHEHLDLRSSPDQILDNSDDNTVRYNSEDDDEVEGRRGRRSSYEEEDDHDEKSSEEISGIDDLGTMHWVPVLNWDLCPPVTYFFDYN